MIWEIQRKLKSRLRQEMKALEQLKVYHAQRDKAEKRLNDILLKISAEEKRLASIIDEKKELQKDLQERKDWLDKLSLNNELKSDLQERKDRLNRWSINLSREVEEIEEAIRPEEDSGMGFVTCSPSPSKKRACSQETIHRAVKRRKIPKIFYNKF